MQTNEGIKPDEAMDVVSRRADVLELMLEEPAFNRDLRSGLGVSRSTAYKALRELEELQLVARGKTGTSQRYWAGSCSRSTNGTRAPSRTSVVSERCSRVSRRRPIFRPASSPEPTSTLRIATLRIDRST